ncbi:CbiX/SirB N-terminal domain-containing protein [Agromyces sp. H66]|uniref:sirohydrochlorin chelatase n=1 Tax=Agromyces sp. H66 TaxID=2529859 RepID=UPI0010AA673A|nr:CbiX/SirB N-terminal domain-containing protein [Agromyces sp. H66]
MTRSAALVAASHGTSSAAGRAAVAALVAEVRRAAPDLVVEDAFVDVQQPDVASVLGSLASGHDPVIVPLLLSAGHHVHVDLAREAAGASGPTLLGAALGPDDRLVEVLCARLAEAGLRGDDRVVLAAAGSSDPRAVADCRDVGRRLAARLGRPVAVGFLSAARPALADAIARTRATHPVSRVVVASYLLAPGYFHDLAVAAGANITTAPLLRPDAPTPAALVELVLDRFAAARALSRAA